MSIRVHPWPILKVHTGTLGANEADPRWITVPAGYRTDFASIPRPMTRMVWSLLPPVGRSGKAAVIHDWLCDEQPHSVDHKTQEGDIRQLEHCQRACAQTDYILHQAALGSVPRSIDDPITTNSANIDGFLNMLVAARDAGVKRVVYAASSSTYGEPPGLPKQEAIIGKPLSPYAVTKVVNERDADVFARIDGLESIGLRYFNVFGPRQDPNGAYAAVIPNWFTFRTRAVESTADEVSDYLLERQIRFDRRPKMAGRSGRGWTPDFHVILPEQGSLVAVLSTGNRSSARTVTEHTLAMWHDLNQLIYGPEALRFISLFDDTADVWQEEDFTLLDSLSEVQRWSEPETLIEALGAPA